MTTKLTAVPAPNLTRAEQILADNSLYQEFEFNPDEVIRLMGGSAANGDNKDPIVFQGEAERKIKALVAKYGFERLPATYGELQALIEYCGTLTLVLGTGIVKTEKRQKEWIATSVGSWERMMKDYVPAGKLYAQGDLEGLKKYHREYDVLTLLGKRYQEFE